MLNRTRLSSLDAFGLRDQRNRIYPALEASDGSTLSLDFTQMSSLDSSRFTFSRATGGGKVGTATYIDGNGYVATASANVPRFAYNPTTLAPLGLMMEGNATNLLNWSESFQTTGGAVNWNFSAVNTTRGTVTTTNPTGSSGTVVKVEETTATGIHATLSVPTVSASTAYTFSVWAKAVERTFVQLYENGGSSATSMVNLSNGNIVSESTAGITKVTAIGTTGWYRIEMRFTTAVGQTSANCQMRLSTNGTTTSYEGTTGSGIYVWGAQLEAGTGATSYIPTTTASVSRAADQLTMSDISTLGYSTAAGTFYYSGQFTQSNTASYPVRIGFMTAGDQPTWEVFTNTSRLFAAARGTGAAPEANLAFTLNTQLRFAASFDASLSTAEVKINLNGSSTSAGPTSLSATFTATRLVIGRTGYEDYFPAGTIAQIKYWPTLKTAAELNLLTTT